MVRTVYSNIRAVYPNKKHVTTHPDICIPNIINISQRVKKLLSSQAFPYKVHSRQITQKGSQGEQTFLHLSHSLSSPLI